MNFAARREPSDDGRCIDAHCSCGCALKLSSKDFTDSARLLALTGGKERWLRQDAALAADLAQVPKRAPRVPESESMKAVRCPGCKCSYEMERYLVDMLVAQRSVMPKCATCRADGVPTKQPRSDGLDHWSDR